MVDNYDKNQKKKSEKNSLSYRQCLNCKRQNPSTSNYCLHCGYALKNTNKCSFCQYYNKHSDQYCTNCGSILENDQFVLQSGKTKTNISTMSNYSYVPYETAPYYSFRTPNSPAWWKMPVFFIILCIFGLTIVTEFLLLIFLIFTVGGLINFDDTITLLVLDALFRIINLLIIAFAVYYFIGFKSFWEPNINKSELIDTHNTDRPKSGFSLIKLISFIIVLLAILLIIDIISFYVITAVKDLLSIAEPIISPYPAFEDSADIFFAFSITAVFVAPFHEELLFRGYFQQAIERTGTPDWTHYLIQGVSFAFIHLPGDVLGGASIDFIFIHMISTGIFGIVATWLKKSYRTVLVPMIFHGLANLLSVIIPVMEQIFLNLTFSLDFDLVLLLASLLITVCFLAFLNIQYQWKFRKPIFLQDGSLKSKSEYQFIIRVLLIIVVFNLLQYGFVFLNEASSFSYILAISVLSITIFILWGRKIFDTQWKDFFPRKNPEKTQVKTGK